MLRSCIARSWGTTAASYGTGTGPTLNTVQEKAAAVVKKATNALDVHHTVFSCVAARRFVWGDHAAWLRDVVAAATSRPVPIGLVVPLHGNAPYA